jgi:hypothetical protein
VPAGAVNAGDESTFRAAFTTDATTAIDLTADITLTCGGGGEPNRSATAGPLTIDGHGHTITQTCPGAGVLQMNGTASLSFANVTITGGTEPASGGGIKSKGPVTLTNTTVQGNTAGSTGGGISALAPLGSVTLVSSTVRNNTAAGGAGGIETAGTATLTNSTVDHNTVTAGGGGGISAVSGVTLLQSTISANTATAGGGGIAAASVTSTNSTITNNTAGAAGGGGLTTPTTSLSYTTIAQNSSPSGANLFTVNLSSFGSVVVLPLGGGTNCVAPVPASSGFNYSDDTSCGFTLASQGDRQNAPDPHLGPLAANGGLTQTRVPQAGSPLIDAIPNAFCQTAPLAIEVTTDQRSLPRPSPGSGACDVGSVEVQVTPLVVTPLFTG